MVIICSINQRSSLAMHSCTILDIQISYAPWRCSAGSCISASACQLASAESVEHGWRVHMPKSLPSLAS